MAELVRGVAETALLEMLLRPNIVEGVLLDVEDVEDCRIVSSFPGNMPSRI